MGDGYFDEYGNEFDENGYPVGSSADGMNVGTGVIDFGGMGDPTAPASGGMSAPSTPWGPDQMTDQQYEDWLWSRPQDYYSGERDEVLGEGVPKTWWEKLLGGIGGGGTPSSSLGSIASGAAKGASDSRLNEAQLAMERDRNRANIFNTQQQAKMRQAEIDLLRRKYQAEVPAVRMANASRGSTLANAQDVVIPDSGRVKVQHWTGGLRPSNWDANTRALGSQVTADMLKQQQSGDTFDPLASLLVPAPSEMDMPQASWWEQALGGLGLGSNLLQAGLRGLSGSGESEETIAKQIAKLFLGDRQLPLND